VKSIERHNETKRGSFATKSFLFVPFQVIKKKHFSSLLLVLLGVLLLVGSFSLITPEAAEATVSVTVTGDGVANPITFSQADLEAMEQYKHVYSTINTWPTKKWYLAEGPRLSELLKKAGIKDEATLIKFKSTDSFTKTLTREQLDAPRYYYPGLKENHEYFGYIPGSPEKAVPVDTILALKSVEGSNDLNDLDNDYDQNAPMLVMGQRWITEQTNELFVKTVKTIEVSTATPGKWENPTANLESGTVPVGTKVELSTSDMDGDNIHYTTDGSDPTIRSPIYNWVKKRWWSSRSDELLEINKPIEINQDTVIKAVAIGPGKEDSDIVTFDYQVLLNQAPTLTPDVTDNIVGKSIEIAFTDDEAWRDAITKLIIDEVVLPESQYAVSEGKIIIDASVFKKPGDYSIVVQAAGYADASVTQKMLFPVVITAPVSDKEFAKGEQVTIKGTTDGILDVLALKVTDPDGQIVYGPTSVEVVDNKFETSFILGSDAKTGTYTIIVDDVIIGSFAVKSGSGGTGPDRDVVLTISGSGVAKEVKLTLPQLQAMKQYQQVYSAINTWPTKKWYVGEGVKLRELLDLAGMKVNNGLIKFTAADSFTMTLTIQELLNDKRYYFPNFKDSGSDADGHIRGSTAGKTEVEPIVGLLSAEGTRNPSYMNDLNSPLLMLGQRAVTEQNGQLFIKNLSKIEVLATGPSRWDKPKADPDGGEVPAGTLVKLSSTFNDDDKVHYTTDGTTPTIESPMYNWIASRWWSSRGDDVEKINKPIEINEDTTIKAITIGPGKLDSDVATFSYKVKVAVTRKTEKIIPSKDSIISLGSEAVVEIPANALQETSEVEIKIEKVTTPPDIPTGFKLVSAVYEFSVDGDNSYDFDKEVTIKLSFDSNAVSEGESLSIYYYDETLGQWVDIGGTVSDNTVTVQVEHFAKFAVMTAEELDSAVSEIITPSVGGTVSLGSEAVIEIPAEAIANTDEVKVKIEKLTKFPDVPKGFKLVGNVYEFSVDGKSSYDFDKEVTIKLSFDPNAVSERESPSIYYYDETLSQWVDIGGTVSDDTVTVQVDHFGKFAVMAAEKKLGTVTLTDIVGHWAEANIEKLVALGAVSGCPDGTFKPDNTVTRAEFVTMLVKAFKLENRGGEPFADTAAHWARDYIAAAVAGGLASGYDADTFGPDNLITREQMAVMIAKAAKLDPVADETQFADSSSISEWARGAVAAAVKNGIIKGCPDNTVRPQASATRAEAVTVIVNALSIL